MRALGLLLAGAILSAASPGHPLRDRVDRSFSPIALGTTTAPARLGLRELSENGCHDGDGCDWSDTNGVRHYFWEDDELVVKTVRAREAGARPIAALGIGRARSRPQVLARVRAFLPEIRISCERMAPEVRCFGTLDEGWFRLVFDRRGRLTEVRLDARHFV